VLRSLLFRGNYENLAAVILLGAAIPSTTRPPEASPQSECLRLNYHSSFWDEVLRHAYYNAMGVLAAGSVGIAETMGFQNLSTGCTHTQVNPMADSSYWRLLGAVSVLVAWTQGIHGPGRAEKPLQPFPTGNLPDWDDIYRFRGYIIQQHFLTRKFRAIEEGGIHREECWSDDLWPVLDRVKARRE
jgi:hypothetical protein